MNTEPVQSAKDTKFPKIETRRQRHIVMFALYLLAKDARAKALAAAQDKQHRYYTAAAVEMYLRDAEYAEEILDAIRNNS